MTTKHPLWRDVIICGPIGVAAGALTIAAWQIALRFVGPMNWEGFAALSALGLGIFNIYWSTFWPGKLLMAMPTSIGLLEGEECNKDMNPLGWWSVNFRVAVALTNTGAQSRIVELLQLNVRGDGISIDAPMGQWKETLIPRSDEGDLVMSGGDIGSALIVPPKSAVERFGVFKARSATAVLKAGLYHCSLNARITGRDGWHRLREFEFVVTESTVLHLAQRTWTRVTTRLSGAAQYSSAGSEDFSTARSDRDSDDRAAGREPSVDRTEEAAMDLPLIQLISEEQRDMRRQIQETFNSSLGHYHQVMVLAAAVLGLVVPALHLGGTSLMDPWYLKAAAIAVAASMAWGLVIHLVGKWIMAWLTFAVERGFTAQNEALSAAASDDTNGEAAASRIRDVKRFTAVVLVLAAIGDFVFFGSFLVGLLLLIVGFKWTP